MKYAGVIVVMVVSLVAFSGCATLAGKVGIASEDYVTAQVEAARASLQMEIDTTNKKLEAAQSEIDQYSQSASNLEQLIESMQRTVQTTDELKQLADVLKGRLENLPVETIRQLVTILEQYLEGK